MSDHLIRARELIELQLPGREFGALGPLADAPRNVDRVPSMSAQVTWRPYRPSGSWRVRTMLARAVAVALEDGIVRAAKRDAEPVAGKVDAADLAGDGPAVGHVAVVMEKFPVPQS